MLFSFLTSQFAHKKAIDHFDEYWLLDKPMPKNRWDQFTSGLNIVAILAFIIGTYFLLSFGSANITEVHVEKKQPLKKAVAGRNVAKPPPKSPAKPSTGKTGGPKPATK